MRRKDPGLTPRQIDDLVWIEQVRWLILAQPRRVLITNGTAPGQYLVIVKGAK